MNKYINLNSAEWCDIVFEDKNKEYGAYDMRQSSGKMHVMALGITILFAMLITALPSVIGLVKETVNKGKVETYKGDYKMTNLETEKRVEVIIPPKEVIPEPPKLKATFKFTPPAIVPDSEITEKNQMKGVDEALNNTLVISTVHNPEGSLDRDAVLPSELTKHQNIVGKGTQIPDKIFEVVEQMPAFPGGQAELYKYLSQNLKYPVSAQEADIQGRVIIRFVVSPSGKIENATLLRGIDSACDNEALRVIRKMPPWIAGKQNGKAVPVYFTLPVAFKLKN